MADGVKTGGRKRGVPNKVNIAVRVRIEREADPLGFWIAIAKGDAIDMDGGAVRPTLDQRMQAQGVLLRKLLPDARSAPVNLALPGVTEAKDVAIAIGNVLDAVTAGKITLEEAIALSGILEIRRKAIETGEL